MRRAVAALLLLGGPLAAQEPVRGTVTDAVTGMPLAAAEVHALGRGGRAWTDNRGRFRLPVLAAIDSVRVIAIGYRERRLAAGAGELAVRLEPLPITLPEIVSTAGRWVERVAEVPAPVVIVAEEELRAQAATAMDQVLAEVPGVQVLPTQPAGTSVAIRGIGEQRVLVLVDGEPVPGALLENQDLSRISVFDAQRVEVTKGPTSSEFGSDALGGVVNLVTAPPPEALQVDALVRGGSFGRKEADLRAGGTAGRVAMQASGSVRQFDAVPGQTGASTFERVWNGRGTARVTASERLAFRADASWFYERQRWPLGETAQSFNGFNDNRGVSGWTEGVWDAAGGRFRTRLFGQTYRYRYRESRGEEPIAGTGTAQREDLVRALTAYTRRLGYHTIDVGAQHSWRTVFSPGRLEDTTSTDRQLELWAKDQARAGKFLLTAGARYTSNDRWGDNLAPSVGAVWEPAATLRVRTSLSRGFRAPNFKETGWRFGNPAFGYEIRGNPDLESETSWAYNLGASWGVGGGIVLDADVYRNDIRNLIDFFSEPNDTVGIVFTPANVARARTQGVELAARWSGGPWRASVSYAYLDAKNLSQDLPLNQRPAHSGRGRLTHETAGVLRGLRTDLSVTVTGASSLVSTDLDQGDAGVTGTREAFVAVDLQAALTLTPAVEVSLGVDNLLDERPANWTGLIQRRYFVGMRTRVMP